MQASWLKSVYVFPGSTCVFYVEGKQLDFKGRGGFFVNKLPKSLY